MNTIQLLARLLPHHVEELKKSTLEPFAVKSVTLQIQTQFSVFNFQGVDAIKGFVCSWDDSYEEALRQFIKQLTPKSEVKKLKRKQAADLLAEIEAS